MEQIDFKDILDHVYSGVYIVDLEPGSHIGIRLLN